MRYIIRQFLGAQRAKEPDIKIEENLFVEGKVFIVGTFVCEKLGQMFQMEHKFENEEELNKTLQEGVIIKE